MPQPKRMAQFMNYGVYALTCVQGKRLSSPFIAHLRRAARFWVGLERDRHTISTSALHFPDFDAGSVFHDCRALLKIGYNVSRQGSRKLVTQRLVGPDAWTEDEEGLFQI